MSSIALRTAYAEELLQTVGQLLKSDGGLDTYNYYVSDTLADGYTLLFSSVDATKAKDYLKKLTEKYNTQGFLLNSTNEETMLIFYDKGAVDLEYRLKVPLENERYTTPEIIGDLSKLIKYGNATEGTQDNIKTIEDTLRSKNKAILFRKAHAFMILNTLHLTDIAGMAFWDYSSIKSFIKRKKSMDLVYANNELPKLVEVSVKL
jgi:hypothetical protein